MARGKEVRVEWRLVKNFLGGFDEEEMRMARKHPFLRLLTGIVVGSDPGT